MSDHHDDTTPADSDAGPLARMRDKSMGFWEHLEELRGTLIKSLLAFVICAALIGYFAKEFNEVLKWPLTSEAAKDPSIDVKLGVQSIMEVFTILIQLCVFGGLGVASPFILFFIAQFVSPALTERETKAVVPMCVSAMVLFLLGAAFAFFLLMPSTIKVASWLGNEFGFENRWTAGNYYSTLTWLTVGSGAVFEFPLVLVLLVWLGVISTAFLRKYRRHAIVVIFIIAAIVTPTPDPFTQTLFAAPLYLLFEISILVSARIEKKRAAKAT
ncbi:MAG: twin-arginine translocase subunit TatC [Opitutaceae bacterium]|nr:twin-arginine translocase subunit TatC [Opitutaceae bacterium]